MSCPKCNAALPDGSAFCNKCGTSVAAPAPGTAATPLAFQPAAQEPEQELWKGRYSGKAQGHWWTLWFVSMPALVNSSRKKLWTGRPPGRTPALALDLGAIDPGPAVLGLPDAQDDAPQLVGQRVDRL